ncbi:hypothetical protein FACS1894170_05780 [Planctomycetales bacterium]|nr:hypothetical protein FACS1894170_05780 [Planctomycetales bacterium]
MVELVEKSCLLTYNRLMLHPDIAFVFALPIESSGVRERMAQVRTTKGNGYTFRSGAFGKLRAVLVHCGIGQSHAKKTTEIVCDVFEPKCICCAGYAGGLSRRLDKLALCIPQQVVRHSDGAVIDLTSAVPQCRDVADSHNLTLLTADSIIAQPDDKIRLGKQFGAELVDMETFAVAEVCRNRQIPLICVRVIFDTAGETITSDVLQLQKSAESGLIHLAGAMTRTVWHRPAALYDLYKLRQDAAKASDKLARQIGNEIKRTG